MIKTINILGVPVAVLDSYSHAVETIIERIKNKQETFVIAINPEKIYWSQKENELKKLINSANFHICDGVGAVIAAKILHRIKVKRVTGIQLFLDLVAKAEKESLKVFLLGATPASNEGTFKKLMRWYPNLQIVGRQDGYFKDSEAVVQEINGSQAEMLFVAMGSPKQEFWIAKHREVIRTPFCMGVGGSFDVISGCVKRAPKVFRKTGTEFLYRLVSNPKRWRRQLVLPKFGLMILKEKIFHPNYWHFQ